MQYSKRYYLLDPTTWHRLQSNRIKNNSDEPPDISVKKQVQSYEQDRVLQKNLNDEILAATAENLEKVGLVTPKSPTVGTTTSSSSNQSVTQPPTDPLEILIDDLEAKSKSQVMRSRMIKLATLIAEIPDIDIDKNKIKVGNTALVGNTYQILNNLVRADHHLISRDVLKLLDKIKGETNSKGLINTKVISNKDAVRYLIDETNRSSTPLRERLNQSAPTPELENFAQFIYGLGPDASTSFQATSSPKGAGKKWLTLFKSRGGKRKKNENGKKNKKRRKRK